MFIEINWIPASAGMTGMTGMIRITEMTEIIRRRQSAQRALKKIKGMRAGRVGACGGQNAERLPLRRQKRERGKTESVKIPFYYLNFFDTGVLSLFLFCFRFRITSFVSLDFLLL